MLIMTRVKINRTKMIMRDVMTMTRMNMKFYQAASLAKEPSEGSRRRWRGYSRIDLGESKKRI